MAFPLPSLWNTSQLGSSRHQFSGDCVNYYSCLKTCLLLGRPVFKKAFDSTLGYMGWGEGET